MANTYANDDARWNAVVERDRTADGMFFYGVMTTGVFCRPGCSSRLPKREHVRFFATPDEAERTGLRACKRCTPTRTHDPHHEMIAQACALIERAEHMPALGELAAAVGLSQFHFQRMFKRIVGVTPKQYALERRRGALSEQLQEETVTNAMYNVGIGSSSQLYNDANVSLGMRPSDYRAGGAGQHIRFGIADSYLGFVLVAATPRGICAIDIGDSPAELEQHLRDRFPRAELVANDPDFQHDVAGVIGMLEAPERGLDLPLDIQGTAFQRRVWEALRAIPAGSTISYTQLAEQINSPRAVRAVAQACAANTLAVAVPCHRVVRSNGELSGYRWGIERKRRLLEREQLRAES